MNNWFTIEEIGEDTFAISEYNHWEETHCYLLIDSSSAVLIDTGLGVENIKEAVESLTTLPITVLATHVHWEHIGGHKYFPNFAVHESEISWISGKFPIPLEVVKKNLTQENCNFPENFNIDDYQIFKGIPEFILHDNEIINIGNRKLQVIHTPGHSPGHCCFYEPDRKYLYSGDLIYKGCLYAFYPTTDPQLFRESVKRIAKLDVKKVLPSHHQLNIAPSIIKQTEAAFDQLQAEGKLKQGSGIFDFGDVQIHV